MVTKTTYELGDNYAVLMDVAKALGAKAGSGEDCLAVLCELSEEGKWVTDETGRRVYHATLEGTDREGITETGVAPVENYSLGGYEIPTRVARRFGLGGEGSLQERRLLFAGQRNDRAPCLQGRSCRLRRP